MITTIETFSEARYTFFKWRCSLPLARKLALALGMAALTGLLAQIKFFLPWTPIPITGQTFAVLLAGIILGKNWGGISQAIYVTMGVVGVPWFTGLSGGYAALIGPRGGYLIGFILAAFFLGHIIDKHIKSRSFISIFGLMLFANFVIIHGLGLLQLGLWFHTVDGVGVTVSELIRMGTAPFIVGDLVKVFAAATLARTIVSSPPWGED